jgi:hypothetical protein
MSNYKTGTLIEDLGNIGVISRIFQKNEHPDAPWAINCRPNYEIHYNNGDVMIMSFASLNRLISKGQIKIIHSPEDKLDE